MRKSIVKAVCMLVAMLLVMTAVCSAMAEETVDFMHILNCEGTAEIIGAADQVRTAAADEALASGEKVRTSEGGITKISLAEAVFVTLDANTEAVFAQEQGSTAVELIEGALFLDVQRELGENEKLEIKVGSFTVNVPGCMVFAFNSPVDIGKTRIGVLEDKVTVGVPDASGMLQEILLSAGQMISSLSAADAQAAAQNGGAEYAVAPVTQADLPGFVEGLIANDSGLMNRVIGGAVDDLRAGNDDQQEVDFSDKNWTWTDRITLIARSASKYYDGTPLAYPSNVLVFGLPDSFSIEVSATGSLTNAGTADNVVGEYKIYNSVKEDVTSHFVNVEKIKGQLVVKPAPLTVWTGSAEKTYDGKPLTNSKATVKTVAWYSSASDPLRNSAVSVETETGENALVATSGRIAVQGIDPVTSQQTSAVITAGQQITMYTGSAGNTEFVITKLKEEELPAEVLRVYAANPQLLAQACQDAGWNLDKMKALIGGLGPQSDFAVETIRDFASVQINAASASNDSVSQAQNSEEAIFTEFNLDPNIKVFATGSQTEIGSSKNTYTIEWGTADPKNYTVQPSMGTLTVLAPEEQEHTEEVVLTAGSDEKVYDGTALTNDGVTCSGLASGYTVQATVSGTQTDAGEAENKITGYKILDSDSKDVTDLFTNVKTENGTLTVTPLKLSISCGGEEVYYNGSEQLPAPTLTYSNGDHAGDTVDGTRTRGSGEQTYRFTLFTGDTVDVNVSGGGKNVDTYEITAAVSATSCSVSNVSISVSASPLTINPAKLTVVIPSDTKPYDGTPLMAGPATITGLAGGDKLMVEITGSQEVVGESDNTYLLIWDKDTLAGNYDVTVTEGKLKVTVNSTLIKIIANSAEKTYDGTALSDNGFTVEGLPSACSVAANVVGEQTEIGSSDNVIESYTICDSNDNNVTSYFTNRETVKGTLTVSAPLPTIGYEPGWTLITYNGRYYQGPVNFDSTYNSLTSQGYNDEEIIQYALGQGIIHTCSNAFSYNQYNTVVKYSGAMYKILNYSTFIKYINDNPSMSDSDVISNAVNAGYITSL